MGKVDEVYAQYKRENPNRRREPTKVWYLAPLLFSFLGGLIGYVVVKDEDRDLAGNLLIVGVLVSFFNFLIMWVSFV